MIPVGLWAGTYVVMYDNIVLLVRLRRCLSGVTYEQVNLYIQGDWC